VLTTLTFALYPNRMQAARLFHFLRAGRLMFNRCLESHKHWYETTGKSLSFYDHCADLTALRSVDPFWADIPLRILRDGARRVDLAYRHFFRRLKEKSRKAGFPRFKSARRWNSFAVDKAGQIVVKGRIRVFGVDGLIRARNVRPIEGKTKQLRVIHRAGRWFAQVIVDDEQSALPLVPVKAAIGIDLGLNCFAAMSNGERVENPRFGQVMAKKLAASHRVVGHRVKGSNRWRTAVHRLQRVYARIANLRRNFTHHASQAVVAEYQLIAVESLRVCNMVRSRFARSILDATWSQFVAQLSYKAERAGCSVVKVNPAGTSQECCECGGVVKKDLSVRVHWCPCGAMLDRDENAARNVLSRALKASREGGSAPPAGRAGVTLVEGSASIRRTKRRTSRPVETRSPN
jgi:putative transposase